MEFDDLIERAAHEELGVRNLLSGGNVARTVYRDALRDAFRKIAEAAYDMGNVAGQESAAKKR